MASSKQILDVPQFRLAASRALTHVLSRWRAAIGSSLPPSWLMGGYLRVVKRTHDATIVVLNDVPENILKRITLYDIDSCRCRWTALRSRRTSLSSLVSIGETVKRALNDFRHTGLRLVLNLQAADPARLLVKPGMVMGARTGLDAERIESLDWCSASETAREIGLGRRRRALSRGFAG
jgi:hypothetical protein